MENKPVTRKHSEMTRDQWVLYRWDEITTCSDPEPIYLRGIYRNFDDTEQAARNFDLVWTCKAAERTTE